MNKAKLFRGLLVVSICIVTILIIYLLIDAFLSDNLLQFVLYAVAEVVFIITIAKATDILVKIENSSKQGTHNNEIELEGVFGEIWHSIDEITKIKDIKVEHLDKSNHTIDMVLLRNKHEFGIVIDDKAIGIIVDEEESDNPLEVELQISEIKDIEYFGKWLIEFVESHS